MAQDGKKDKKAGATDSRVTMRGLVTLTLTGPDGAVKQRRTANTVTAAGKADMAQQVLASPGADTTPTHMAIGTGSPSGTALGTEVSRAALASKTASGAVVTMTATYAAGVPSGTNVLTEAGIFTQSSNGDMWLSASFGAITKAPSDSLTVSWTLTFA